MDLIESDLNKTLIDESLNKFGKFKKSDSNN